MIPGIVAASQRAAGGPGDPFWDQVVASLHMDGVDGSTTFVDEKGHVFTASGNAQIDTAQSRFGGGSLLLDGVNDFISSPDSSDWSLGSGDFTIDCWVRFNGDPGAGLVTFVSHYGSVGATRGWFFGINANTLRFLYSNDGLDFVILSTPWNPLTATWYYTSVVRRGPTVYFFVDGVLLGTASIGTATIFDAPHALEIGVQDGGANGDMNGWIDDVRITKAARYTTSFSRPDRAHHDNVTALGDQFYDQVISLAHFNTTLADRKGIVWTAAGDAAVDATQSVFGGSSLRVDGTGDYISASDPAFAFGTGDFTVECWVRFASRSGNNFVFCFGGGIGVYTFTNQWAVFDGVSTNIIQGGTTANDTWYHVALTRTGTSMRLFVNGTQVGSTATNSTNFSSNDMRLGAQPSGSGTMNGWIDDFRATDAARYAGAFQFPLLQFPDRLGDPFFEHVISLNHWDGADGATTYADRIVGRTWTNTTGASELDTSEFKFAPSALKLPGTALNQVESDSGADWAFGTEDFTIEFWFRVGTLGTVMLWDQRTSVSQPRACIFLQTSTLLYYVNNVTRITGGNLTASTWQHIAVSRLNGSTRLFIDGVQQGSTYVDATDYTAGRVSLGTAGDTPGFGNHAGAYDDIRVTKGVGRYAGNFVPLPVAFANAA